MQQQGCKASQCCRNLTLQKTGNRVQKFVPSLTTFGCYLWKAITPEARKTDLQSAKRLYYQSKAPATSDYLYVWHKCIRIYHSVPHICPPFCNLILDSLVSTVKCSSEHQLLTQGWLGLRLETNLEGKELFCHPDMCVPFEVTKFFFAGLR